jgi:hypothetical protein
MKFLGLLAMMLGGLADPILWIAVIPGWNSKSLKRAACYGAVVGCALAAFISVTSSRRFDYILLFFLKACDGAILAAAAYGLKKVLRRKAAQ